MARLAIFARDGNVPNIIIGRQVAIRWGLTLTFHDFFKNSMVQKQPAGKYAFQKLTVPGTGITFTAMFLCTTLKSRNT